MIPVLDCTVEKDNLERFYTQDHFNVILRNSIILLKKSDNMDCKWRNTEGRVITITPTPTRSALVRHNVETSNSASPGRVQSGAIPAGRRWWQRSPQSVSKVRSTEYNIYIYISRVHQCTKYRTDQECHSLRSRGSIAGSIGGGSRTNVMAACSDVPTPRVVS